MEGIQGQPTENTSTGGLELPPASIAAEPAPTQADISKQIGALLTESIALEAAKLPQPTPSAAPELSARVDELEKTIAEIKIKLEFHGISGPR